MYLRVSAILGLHTIFILLALTRILSPESGAGGWNWAFVFIPLFIFDALSVILWVIYLVSYIAVKTSYDSSWSSRNSIIFPSQKISISHLITFGIGVPLKTTAEILLVLHLQDEPSVSLLPPVVLFVLLFLDVAAVAACEAMSPVVKLLISECREDWDLEECDCFTCLGHLNLCCRRCLYHICTCSMRMC